MATFAKQDGSATITYGAVSASDDWVNSGSEKLHVKNGGGGAVTVTVIGRNPCDQGQLHNRVVSVPAGADRLIRPCPPGQFNDGASKATVTFSPTTLVTAALLG